MTNEELQKRVAELEAEVARLRLARRITVIAHSHAWASNRLTPMSDEEVRGREEDAVYGYYYASTGRQPPDEWRPGDPIPELDPE